MTKTLRLFCPSLHLAVLALTDAAFAQYGGQGLGSALSSNPLSHQGQVRPGVDDVCQSRRARDAIQDHKRRRVGPQRCGSRTRALPS